MDAVQQQVDAFNRRDVEQFLAAYAPDVVIEDAGGEVFVRGHDGIRALYGALFAQSPDLHAEIVNQIRVGEYVIDEERTRGINFEGFPAELHTAMIYRVVDGLIAHARMLAG
jgi:hypothetical protein